MTDIEQFVKRAMGIQGKIARDVWPNGGILSCSRCGRVQSVTAENCGVYLAHGWPKCCGFTMTVEATR